MLNLEGKNIVFLGGLSGLGISITKNLLVKKIANLCIIDCIDNERVLNELRSEFKSTNITFNHMELTNLNLEELNSLLLKINKKMEHIDLFINGLEILTERDLQRSMNLNMNLYLNVALLVRDLMDKSKGGRGGLIINLLSILGYHDDLNIQQYLINKQMLLSLTESLAQDIRYKQSGVEILALMPNINQRHLLRNQDWIRAIGLQNMLWDLKRTDLLMGDTDRQDTLRRVGLRRDVLRDDNLHRDLLRDDIRLDDFALDDLDRDQRRRDQRRYMDDDLHRDRSHELDGRWLQDNLRRDGYLPLDDLRSERGQRWGSPDLDGRRIIELLGKNIARCIELSQNGMLLLVGLKDCKNVQKDMQLSRM